MSFASGYYAKNANQFIPFVTNFTFKICVQDDDVGGITDIMTLSHLCHNHIPPAIGIGVGMEYHVGLFNDPGPPLIFTETVAQTGKLDCVQTNITASNNKSEFQFQDINSLAVANTFEKGFTVGNVNPAFDRVAGIQRASAVTGNEWEDGHLGNATHLIFSQSEFRGVNLALTPPGGTAQHHPLVACKYDSDFLSLLTLRISDRDGYQLVAMKPIPKGFYIPETGPVIVSCALAAGFPDGSSIEVVGVNLVPDVPLTQLSASTVLTFADGLSNNCTINNGSNAGATGTGTNMCAVAITILPEGIFGSARNGLLGVQVPIARGGFT